MAVPRLPRRARLPPTPPPSPTETDSAPAAAEVGDQGRIDRPPGRPGTREEERERERDLLTFHFSSTAPSRNMSFGKKLKYFLYRQFVCFSPYLYLCFI